MTIGVKLGGKIAALDHDVFLETCQGKSYAIAVADAYTKIVRRERMPLDIKVRQAFNRGFYSLWAIPRKERKH